MAAQSETVAQSMDDIHRTLKEARRTHGLGSRPVKTPARRTQDVTPLVSEIDRLSSMLKSVAHSYEQLANAVFSDPFSQEYEEVLLQLDSVKRVLSKAESCVKAHRNGIKSIERTPQNREFVSFNILT